MAFYFWILVIAAVVIIYAIFTYIDYRRADKVEKNSKASHDYTIRLIYSDDYNPDNMYMFLDICGEEDLKTLVKKAPEFIKMDYVKFNK